MTDTPLAWHTLSCAESLRQQDTTQDGLSAAQAAQRLRRYGPNELTQAERISAFKVLANQFKSALIVILLIATAVSAGLGHAVESLAIAIIVSLAILLGFVQEFRAERAIVLLREMAAPSARVVRAGREEIIPARALVPGDIISVVAGDIVPADGRLLQAHNLQVDEASLTGESQPVMKRTDALASAELAVGDRSNLIYSGTIVTYGRGQALVVATGMQTEFGKISGMLAGVEEPPTPLQRSMDRLGKVLAVIALGIVVTIVTLGLVRGAAPIDILLFGVALAVAVVPEALPAVVTISLAVGIQRMAKRNALMRHLPAVETLGSTSVICTDKTGTLTKDEMTARKLWVDGRLIGVSGTGYAPEGTFDVNGKEIAPTGVLTTFLSAAVLASDARLVCKDGRWHIRGDPSEGAFLTLAAKAGLDRTALEEAEPRLGEIQFSSERKRMTTLNGKDGHATAYSKGAPEIILAACERQLLADGPRVLDDDARAALESAAAAMAAEALRVLAVAYKPDARLDDAEDNMIFLGFAGLSDPPREEVAQAIRTCNAAGIKPVMITGDHPATGAAIARELGMLTTGRVVTGTELRAMSGDELERNIDTIEVYARVSPEQKIRVVDAWQRRGAVVAMTGDGVNDAPALKKADVGIAMGRTGTDVSREAADMTLTDDDFTTIVGAMAEGRRVFNNIKKYLMYLLSANIGEIGLMAVATLAGLPLPLTAVQILYVNLATDGLPALALAVDPADPNLMRLPPRDPRRSIFTRPVVMLMLAGGVWSTIVNLWVFSSTLRAGRTIEEAMAMTFLCLVLIELCKVYNFRSDRNTVFRSPFANRWVNLAVAWELALLTIIVYVPVLQLPFGTYSLTPADWLLVTGAALTIIPVLELAKLLVRHRLFGLPA